MTRPVLEYFWCKILADSITHIPQFDPETGKENFWKADTAPLSKVLLVPFSPELADKVILCGIPALSSNNQIVEFNVCKGEQVEAGRDNILTYEDFFICDICGWKFKHLDGSKYAKCPQCWTSDDWYCSRCKEFKTEFRTTKRNQVQCLECDIPVGLDRTKKLHRITDVKHSCDYFIRSNNKKVTVTSNGKIIIE